MNNIYPPQSQAPQPLPLQINSQMGAHPHPAAGQNDYAHHPVSQPHPAMTLPPPPGYADQFAQSAAAAQGDLQSPTTPAQESKPTPTAEQLAATQKALAPVCGKEDSRQFR